MIQRSVTRFACFTVLTLAVGLSAFAHEPHVTIPEPGFRPESEFAATFLDAVDSATIAVYPTIVRRDKRTAHSFASQQHIADFMRDHNLATVVAAKKRVDLGGLSGTAFASQWELFNYDMEQIAAALQGKQPDVQYHMVLEFVLPVSDQEIFGVHCFILDQQGQNAFSFLLNSHHQLFADADLVAQGRSEEARARLMDRATNAAVIALYAQIENARRAPQS